MRSRACPPHSPTTVENDATRSATRDAASGLSRVQGDKGRCAASHLWQLAVPFLDLLPLHQRCCQRRIEDAVRLGLAFSIDHGLLSLDLLLLQDLGLRLDLLLGDL